MNLPKIHFKDLNEREYLEFFKSLIEYFKKSNKSFFEILLGLARSYEDLEPYLESKTHTLKESSSYLLKFHYHFQKLEEISLDIKQSYKRIGDYIHADSNVV